MAVSIAVAVDGRNSRQNPDIVAAEKMLISIFQRKETTGGRNQSKVKKETKHLAFFVVMIFSR